MYGVHRLSGNEMVTLQPALRAPRTRSPPISPCTVRGRASSDALQHPGQTARLCVDLDRVCVDLDLKAPPAPCHSLVPRAFTQVRAHNLAPAIGLEPITCRLTEGLSWAWKHRPCEVDQPRHLHKGLSEACSSILAAVPTCTAECRSVRVTRVLDASDPNPRVGWRHAVVGSGDRGYLLG